MFDSGRRIGTGMDKRGVGLFMAWLSLSPCRSASTHTVNQSVAHSLLSSIYLSLSLIKQLPPPPRGSHTDSQHTDTQFRM